MFCNDTFSRGCIWESEMIELNQIIHADCMDIMKDIPDKYFELAIVDPPYRDSIDNSPTEIMRKKGGMKKWFNKPDKTYFDELMRVSKDQIIFGGNYFTDILPPTNNWIIWYKNNEGVKYSMCEMAWNSGPTKYTQLFQYRPMGKLAGIHPTEKPIDLYKWILRKYAKPGDKIIDTHMGSGSSVIACIDMGFEYLAIEKDADYVKAARERIDDFKLQGKLAI